MYDGETARASGAEDLADEMQRDREAVIRMARQARAIARRIKAEEDWADAALAVARENIAPLRSELHTIEEQIRTLARGVLPPGRKSVTLPGVGRAAYRKRPESIAIDDPDALIAWAEEHEEAATFVRTSKHLQMANARQYAIEHLKETGEALPGVGEYTPEDEYGHFALDLDLAVWEETL